MYQDIWAEGAESNVLDETEPHMYKGRYLNDFLYQQTMSNS